ncbi:Uma2 family endonuclease [Streptomyces sp. NL15-2K]|uniref:Uma2 family endonuclease n=1 Tax=Streptomyces sp. NL15-2K TaxID=376149 RepID=UPI000F563A19|nr:MULTISPECIES: Uma2 family endonuclease [Actinomycetes]WKX11943.1 Uma2 family endonuclease [Kutzneria buriramensis]
MGLVSGDGFAVFDLVEQIIRQDPEVAVLVGTDMNVAGWRCVPDVIVVAKADKAGLALRASVPASVVRAVIELDSPSSLEVHLKAYVAAYPRVDIPLLMIMNSRTGEIEVHTNIIHGRYTESTRYAYGDTVQFGPWAIRTEWPTYLVRANPYLVKDDEGHTRLVWGDGGPIRMVWGEAPGRPTHPASDDGPGWLVSVFRRLFRR